MLLFLRRFLDVSDIFSPDSRENPFLFLLKKEKIKTNSWK